MATLVYLTTVSAIGTLNDIPPFGIAGRVFYATDTRQKFYDTGTAWENISDGGVAATTLTAAPTEIGPFSIAHGLTFTPSRISITMTSAGEIWQQSPADGTNVYLNASDANISAFIYVFA